MAHVYFVVLLVSAALVAKSSLAVAQKQPHILMVLADDYGWHDIGYHGSEIETPVLDKLASEGVKLERYYVQPVCTPSRSQLMSGRYQIYTGLQHRVIHPPQPNGLPLELPTIADKLREVGYATHIVGKWHLGFYKKEYTPLHRGFDSFYGYYSGAEDYFTHVRCEPYSGKEACGFDLRDGETPVQANNTYSAHLFAKKAEEVIANHDPNKPLFLYLPLQSVHKPLQVPASYEAKYSWITSKSRRTYAGMVSAMDEAIGNVTEAMKQHGLWNNTVMVFSTDNGGPLGSANNWPLRGSKTTLWEGGTRGVGFVHGFLEGTEGTESHELVHISDWYPTFLHLAGGSANGTKLDGFNVWDTVSKNQPSPRQELLHNIDPLTDKKGNNSYPDIYDVRVRSALRKGDWKIITGDPGDGSWQPKPNGSKLLFEPMYVDNTNDTKNLWLFNVTADPLEKTDLSEQYPDVVKSLLERLAIYAAGAVQCRYPAFDPASNPEKHGGIWTWWEQDDSTDAGTGNDHSIRFDNILQSSDADPPVLLYRDDSSDQSNNLRGEIYVESADVEVVYIMQPVKVQPLFPTSHSHILGGLLCALVVMCAFGILIRFRRRSFTVRVEKDMFVHD